jgi:ABC-type branched-subunit amino acid transport system substrate-binding protein
VIRVLASLLLVAACHTGVRHTLVPDVPTTGDAHARARFQEARAAFEHDGSDGDAFADIVREYPDDPIAPWAELYAGIAAVKARDWPGADAQLTKAADAQNAPGLVAHARLYLGITKNYEGDTAAARTLLVGADRAIENDAERTEYLAALAYATAAGDQPLASLPMFDELYDRVTPTERAVLVARLEQVVATASADQLARVYDELGDRKGPSVAIVGSRLALAAEQAGDAARAAQLRTDVAPLRLALGLPRAINELPPPPVASGGGEPGLLGAVLPLGGRENRVAVATVAGLGLAAGAPDGDGVAAVETRVAVDPATSAQAVDVLAAGNVVAIIGPIDGASVDAAGARAEALGVPLLSLATAPEQRASGPFVFHVRHAAEARARTLAQRALDHGVRTFAVLAPDSGYGKAVSAAFADVIAKGGGRVVVSETYPRDAHSFAKAAASLGKSWQAVFVPDDAEKLGLIAPALAAAGNLSKPVDFPKRKRLLGGRPVLLLSTAEGLSSSFLADAGRHAEGAWLAPGFYPDDADPTAKPFIDRFEAAYGRAPGAAEAYAYDAAQLAAAAGASGRAGLASTLATGQLVGVTGTIRFDAAHRRADPGVIYTVVEETGGGYAIRVAP